MESTERFRLGRARNFKSWEFEREGTGVWTIKGLFHLVSSKFTIGTRKTDRGVNTRTGGHESQVFEKVQSAIGS